MTNYTQSMGSKNPKSQSCIGPYSTLRERHQIWQAVTNHYMKWIQGEQSTGEKACWFGGHTCTKDDRAHLCWITIKCFILTLWNHKFIKEADLLVTQAVS